MATVVSSEDETLITVCGTHNLPLLPLVLKEVAGVMKWLLKVALLVVK